MKLAVAGIILLLAAGCAQPDGRETPLVEDEQCPAPCLAAVDRVDLQACESVNMAVPVYGYQFELPPGYEAASGTLAPGASQLANVLIWECQGGVIAGEEIGATAWAEVAVIVEAPGNGPEATSYHYAIQQFASGALLGILQAHGFETAAGTPAVDLSETGRTGLVDEVGLTVSITHAPPQGRFAFHTVHHGPQGWYHEVPDCPGTTPLAAPAMVDPGTSAMAPAAGAAGVFYGFDAQDGGPCDVRLEFGSS